MVLELGDFFVISSKNKPHKMFLILKKVSR